jgi:predicted RNA-binding protein associated with RNAse of E/G family
VDRFEGWYVNLEQPWTRTTVGFDSRDDVLDVSVADDLRSCRLKDENELEFAVEVGLLTSIDVLSIRATAQSAMNDIASREWPFTESFWQTLRPCGEHHPLALPVGWDEP